MSTPTGLEYERWYCKTFNQSDFIQLLGMKLKRFGGGSSRLQLEVGQKHLNLQGKVQGGVIATMVDSGMSAAIRSYMGPGQSLVTVELKLNYLVAASQGDRLEAKGEVLRFGSQVAVARVMVRNGLDRIVAAGQGTFMVIEGSL